jgi:[ribosomal protein S18]-alanine N-acetyltransferase
MKRRQSAASADSACKRFLTVGRAADGPPVVVEPARVGDLVALIELDRVCFNRRAWSPAAWAEVVTQPEWTTLVIRAADTVVGAEVLLLWAPAAHLASIGVHPDHRNCGLGTAMLRDALRRARDSHARALSLEVDRANTAARRLYVREGFGLVRRFREDGRWRVEMRRRLGRGDG